MAGEGALDPGWQLVSGLCSQPEFRIGRNASNCERPWREVSVDQLQEREYASLVGMQAWTSMESMCSECESWDPKERKLVQKVLQRAATISREAEHNSIERFGKRAWGHVFVRGISWEQIQIDVEM
jgi:hypothetical protein